MTRSIPGYHFLTPVWGRDYTRLYIDICIPAQLASENLGAFRDVAGTRYIIYTRPEDAERIRSAELFKALSDVVAVQFEFIADDTAVKYDLMSNCYRRGISLADDVGAAVVFLTPDVVFSNGSFAALRRLAESGCDVVFAPGIRTLKQSVTCDLSNRFRHGTIIEIAPRDLMRVALDNLHPMGNSSFWEEGEGDLIPANLYWRAGTEGIVARCFHLHPLLVNPQRKHPTFFGTVDDDYVCAACPDASHDHVVTDSDELLMIELSDAGRTLPIGLRKGSIADAAIWAELSANSRHRTLFDHTLRLHTDIRDQDQWRAAEQSAERVASSIKERLIWPTWRLALRLDGSFVNQLLRISTDRRLELANDEEDARSGLASLVRLPMTLLSGLFSVRGPLYNFYSSLRNIQNVVFGTAARPRFWTLSAQYFRVLRHDVTELASVSRGALVISNDPSNSLICTVLRDAGYEVATVAMKADSESRPMSDPSSAAMPAECQNLVVIDRAFAPSGQPSSAVDEAFRVLRPGGRVLVLANGSVATSPADTSALLTADSVAGLLTSKFIVVEQRKQGGVGMATATVAGQWVRRALVHQPRIRGLRRVLNVLMIPLLPVLIVLSFIVTRIVALIDVLDRTGQFYVTSLTCAKRPAE